MRRPGSGMTRTALTNRIRFPEASPPATTRPVTTRPVTMRPGTTTRGTERNCAPGDWSVTSTPPRAVRRPTRCAKRRGFATRPPPMRRRGSGVDEGAVSGRPRLRRHDWSDDVTRQEDPRVRDIPEAENDPIVRGDDDPRGI